MYAKIIQEIHSEFMGSNADQKKALRLINNGFDNAEQANDTSKHAKYFKEKYPIYKFISKKKTLDICKKYNLYIGRHEWFNGFVPEFVLDELDKFKLNFKNEDLFKCKTDEGRKYIFDYRKISFNNLPDIAKCRALSGESETVLRKNILSRPITYYHKIRELFIAAPLSKFNIPKEYKPNRKTRKIEIPDPILMQKVKGGYLIIRAWGDESCDQDVINPINN